jgi:hypothetical protein
MTSALAPLVFCLPNLHPRSVAFAWTFKAVWRSIRHTPAGCGEVARAHAKRSETPLPRFLRRPAKTGEAARFRQRWQRIPATPRLTVATMATHTGNTGNIIALPQWLPATEAARVLGIAERTLRLHAERGRVARRRDGRAVLYQVTPATHSGIPVAAIVDVPAMPVIPATDTGNASALVTALVDAVGRATRAELAADDARAELDRLRIDVDALRTELATARRGWCRAHAGWQVARAALAKLTMPA